MRVLPKRLFDDTVLPYSVHKNPKLFQPQLAFMFFRTEWIENTLEYKVSEFY